MGEAITNLVIVKGDKNEVANFRKAAYLDESRAFHFKRLIPVPEEVLKKSGNTGKLSKEEIQWRHNHYGNKWGAGFSVIFKESPTEIHYFFNSKNIYANISFVAAKYPALNFEHFYYDYYSNGYAEFYGYKEYANGKYIDFELPSSGDDLGYDAYYYLDAMRYEGVIESELSLCPETEMRTPANLEEMLYKFQILRKNNPEILAIAIDNSWHNFSNPYEDWLPLSKKSFYDFYPRQKFLKDNVNFYRDLFHLEKVLWKKELKYAKEIGYPLQINDNNLFKEILQF